MRINEIFKKNQVRLIRYVFVLQLTLLQIAGVADMHAATPDVKMNVNWADFMGNLDPVWDSLPTVPKHGPMIGNGMLGTYLIHNEESGEIRFEMSRGDLCDVRAGFNRRKTNGYFKLTLADGTPTGKCRLDLWDAQLKADLALSSGSLSLRAFTDANSDVIVFELIKSEPTASQHATAWRIVEVDGKTYIYASTTHSYRTSTAKQAAVDNINKAVAKGFSRLEAEHQDWWHNFYQKSFVTLPQKFEWFHWMQMYKIASMTRANAQGNIKIDLKGTIKI